MWAYLLYALVALSLLGFVLYNYRRRANQQLNEEKMKFLINATHDIRTPQSSFNSLNILILASFLKPGKTLAA